MTTDDDLERRLADFYASEAAPRAPDRVLQAALATIDHTSQRHGFTSLPWRFQAMSTNAKLAVTALAVMTVGLIALVLVLAGTPQIVGPEPLNWTPQRFEEDWPAPVRTEPPGAPIVLPLQIGDSAIWDIEQARWQQIEYADTVGDAGQDRPWLDIAEVHHSLRLTTVAFVLELAEPAPRPRPHPGTRWVAYGVVLDTDLDGTADVRIGIDNMPGNEHRAWRTDLATGETMWSAGFPYGWVGHPEGSDQVADPGEGLTIGLDTYYPTEEGAGAAAVLRYSLQPNEQTYRFYAWASDIEDGRIVATDFAPDAGWLEVPIQPQLTLEGPAWTLETEFSRDGQTMGLVQTLTFTGDGRIGIEAGCNSGSASVVVGEASLVVSALALTEQSCSPEVADIDAMLLEVLSANQIGYRIDGGVLELRAGSRSLRFQAIYEPY